MKILPSNPTNEVYERLIAAIPVTDRNNFNNEQLYVLRQACQKLAPRKHAIDIRVSVPIFHRPGFYLVFLAGSERRQLPRTIKERQLFWTFIYLLLGAMGLVGGLMLRMPMMTSHLSYIEQPAPPQPTSLPWITDEADCKGSDRFWEDGACWDRQHDPSF